MHFLFIPRHTYDASHLNFEFKCVHQIVKGISADVPAMKLAQTCTVLASSKPKISSIAFQICVALTSIPSDVCHTVVSCEVFVVIWWPGLELHEDKDSLEIEHWVYQNVGEIAVPLFIHFATWATLLSFWIRPKWLGGTFIECSFFSN